MLGLRPRRHPKLGPGLIGAAISTVLILAALGIYHVLNDPLQPGGPSASDIVQCVTTVRPSLDPVKLGLKVNQSAIAEKAGQVYEKIKKGEEIERATATTVAYASNYSQLDADGRAEAIAILSGLDSCERSSNVFKDAFHGALGLLLGPTTVIPNAGARLCPDINPFGPQEKYRFEPNCGLAGTWLFSRSIADCRNFPEGCDTTPILIKFSNCDNSPVQPSCSISRPDGVWQTHTIMMANGVWRATFTDYAIKCHGAPNFASISLRLNDPDATESGLPLAGEYEVSASANPPDCSADAHALEQLGGRRPPY